MRVKVRATGRAISLSRRREKKKALGSSIFFGGGGGGGWGRGRRVVCSPSILVGVCIALCKDWLLTRASCGFPLSSSPARCPAGARTCTWRGRCGQDSPRSQSPRTRLQRGKNCWRLHWQLNAIMAALNFQILYPPIMNSFKQSS